MKIYSLQIGQLEDSYLSWIIDQAKQQWDKSPEFFAALDNACSAEKQRRLLKPNDPPTELSIPWIVENETRYQSACQFAVFSMQSAHEQCQYPFRNFWSVCVKVLYDQATTAIAEHLAGRTVSPEKY